MKTKLEMAHDYAMKHIQEGWDINYDVLVVEAWQYADAMQAEADKREPSGFPNVLRGACGEIVAVKVDDKEWQPDWSQAPDGYNWWAMDGFSGVANWYKSEPFLDDDDTDEWNVVLLIATYREAPSFGYTGDWRESLRKRPK